MRLVDYLIFLLQAQGQTMQRMAALFGEDFFFQMLEVAGEARAELPLPRISARPLESLFGPPVQNPPTSAYGALEGAVHELSLPAIMEFHLWAYPTYRAFIESEVSLDATIRTDTEGLAQELIEEAVAQAEAWLKLLPIPDEYRPRAESAARVPWLRFRTQVLDRVGTRRFGAV